MYLHDPCVILYPEKLLIIKTDQCVLYDSFNCIIIVINIILNKHLMDTMFCRNCLYNIGYYIY